MADINWRVAYGTFLAATEQNIAQADEMLKTLASHLYERESWVGVSNDASMYHALHSVETNFCRINNRRLAEEAKPEIDMSFDADRPFHWYYWRETLPQGSEAEDFLPSGQRAFERAALWATKRDDAFKIEIPKFAVAKKTAGDPQPFFSPVTPSPISRAKRRPTDPRARRQPMMILAA